MTQPLKLSLAVLALSACGSGTAPEEPDHAYGHLSKGSLVCGPEVVTESRLNVLPEEVRVAWSDSAYQATVPIQLFNGSGRELRLAHQQTRLDFRLEKWVDNEWIQGWANSTTAALHVGIPVCPDGVLIDFLFVWGNANLRGFSTDPYAGTYRVVLSDGPGENFEAVEPAPAEALISDSFELR